MFDTKKSSIGNGGYGYLPEKKFLHPFLLKMKWKLSPYLQTKQHEDRNAPFPYPLIWRGEEWGMVVFAKKQVFGEKYHYDYLLSFY